MKSLLNNRVHLLPMLLAGVLLRALTPAGYMPGSLDSGRLFELCPDGIPAGLMIVISGGQAHHHHQHHHHDSGHAGGQQPGVTGSDQCDLGHLLTGTVIESAIPGFSVETPTAVVQWPDAPVRAIVSAWIAHAPRGPPLPV